MYLFANFPLNITVKEFFKSVKISQSYEQITRGTFFLWLTVYSTVKTEDTEAALWDRVVPMGLVLRSTSSLSLIYLICSSTDRPPP